VPKENESLNEGIKEYEIRMKKSARESYPQVEPLKQARRVGMKIAPTYVLTLEDPYRLPLELRGRPLSQVVPWAQGLEREPAAQATDRGRVPGDVGPQHADSGSHHA
jgi:hypothetical protein